MALKIEHFIFPRGRLSEEWFPEGKLPEYIQGWIDDATTQSTDEDAQALWVYHRAFQQLADQANASPAEQRTWDNWDRFTDKQLLYFEGEANRYQAMFVRLVNGGWIPVVVGYIPNG